MQNYRVDIEKWSANDGKRVTKIMRASNIDNLRKNLISKRIANTEVKVYVSKIPSNGTADIWIGCIYPCLFIDEKNRSSEFRPAWYDEKGFEHWISMKTGKLTGRVRT